MFKKLLLALALMLGVAAGAVAVESPASASYSDCGVGLACIWTSTNGNGSKYTISVTGSNGIGTCNLLPFDFRWSNQSAKVGFGGGLRLWMYNYNTAGIWCGNLVLVAGPNVSFNFPIQSAGQVTAYEIYY